MGRMKLSTQLAGGLAMMLLLIALVGATAWQRMETMSRLTHQALHEQYGLVRLYVQLRENNLIVARAMRDMLLSTDARRTAELQAEIDAASKTTVAAFDTIKVALADDTSKALFQRLVDAREAYRGPRARLTRLLKDGHADEARRLLDAEVQPLHKVYIDAVSGLIAHGNRQMALADEGVAAQARETRLIVAALVLLALALACGGGIWMVGNTTRSLRQAVKLTRRVAEGDLGTTIRAEGTAEVAELLQALADMQQRLTAIVGEVRRNAQGVATASTQIASGNADLSARTESQASALQQTAAAMEQLGSTVRANSENAQTASQLALEARSVAERGGQAMTEVVATITAISEGSRRIADIIGVIDGIAFQTNILALNAAVEAARAGEQGRGFAVVAGEVRSLAGRSAEAAREIRSLIARSTERVERGTQQVDSAGATILEAVRAIGRLADIVAEISAASREQSTGVSQVADAVTGMDRNTQQNAALVEESAAAAANLQRQAQLMVSAVAAFRLTAAA